VTVIRTDRVILRPPAERDVAALVAGCSDPEVARYIPVIPAPYDDQDARDWLAGADDRATALDERSFAITLPEHDELLGMVSVRLRSGGSIGCWLRPEGRGRGLMTEAVRAVVSWADEAHGIRELFITAHPANIASQRVAEAAGFVRIGIVEHDPPFRDGTHRASGSSRADSPRIDAGHDGARAATRDHVPPGGSGSPRRSCPRGHASRRGWPRCCHCCTSTASPPPISGRRWSSSSAPGMGCPRPRSPG
jgi:RimJ/RimL family protein N-acetyltransferase